MNEALQPMVGGTSALAVWLGGTANLLAKELGLPREVGPVADMIASRRVLKALRSQEEAAFGNHGVAQLYTIQNHVGIADRSP